RASRQGLRPLPHRACGPDQKLPFVDGATEGIAEADFDQQISIMSLPHTFGTTLETIPTPIPYLVSDDALKSKWARRMRGAAFKVGLVCAGRLRRNQPRFHIIDRNRNLSLREMHSSLGIGQMIP